MILIAGASGGIGKYLYDTYKRYYPKEVFGTCNKNNENKELYPINIENYDDVLSWKEHIIKNTVPTRISLINCTGIKYDCFLHKSIPQEWERVIKVNLIGTYNLLRCFLPIMRTEQYGRIINFSSVVAQKGVMGTSAYAASKSALWGLAKAVAIENAEYNITINNINLGYANIGMGKGMNKIIDTIPMKRMCQETEILETIMYLCNNSYITGTSIDLNGGLV